MKFSAIFIGAIAGLLVFSWATGSSHYTSPDYRAGIQFSDIRNCDQQIGPERYTGFLSNGGGESGWATDDNSYDPDCIRVGFFYDLPPKDPYIREPLSQVSTDFRACLQLADHMNGRGGNDVTQWSQEGTKQCTPYLSELGNAGVTGWSKWAKDANVYDPDGGRISLETRAWPTGVERGYYYVRLGVQASDGACTSQKGYIRYTPWQGGWSVYASDSNFYDPDCFRIQLVRVEAPPPPTFFEFSDTYADCGGKVDITWPKGVSWPRSNGVYLIERSDNPTDGFVAIAAVNANATFNHFIDGANLNDPLIPGQEYYYRFYAYSNTAGGVLSLPSEVISTTATEACLGSFTNPQAEYCSTQANLSWDAILNAVAYDVARSAPGDSSTFGTPVTTTSTSYTDPGPITLDTYYQIIAYDAGNNALADSGALALTDAQCVPLTPSGFTANTGPSCGGEIHLTWNTGGDANGFRLWRSTSSDGTYTHIVTLGGGTNVYTDTGLATDQTYYYKIEAYNPNGLSPQAGPVSAVSSASCGGGGGGDPPPPPSPQCSDEADNDGDGLIDFPADPGCSDANDDDEVNSTQPGIIEINP